MAENGDLAKQLLQAMMAFSNEQERMNPQDSLAKTVVGTMGPQRLMVTFDKEGCHVDLPNDNHAFSALMSAAMDEFFNYGKPDDESKFKLLILLSDVLQENMTHLLHQAIFDSEMQHD